MGVHATPGLPDRPTSPSSRFRNAPPIHAGTGSGIADLLSPTEAQARW